MILIGDLHISADRARYSLLKVKPRENDYSMRFCPRLAHLYETIKWIDNKPCGGLFKKIVQLGDIVSKATLDAEELSMISEVGCITEEWTCIRGNHGLGINNHDSDSAVRLKEIIRRPQWLVEEDWESGKFYNLVYLPYVLEKDRKPLSEYLEGMDISLPTLILNHNDIKGMDYGGYIEKNGWSIEELEDWGDLIICGHIHNQQWLTDKILIVGNVDGENLTEDYRLHPHGIWRLDEGAFLDGVEPKQCMEFIENPYAMKFANVEIKKEEDIAKIKAESDDRTILAITVPESLADKAQDLIDNHLAGGKKIVKSDGKRKKTVDKIVLENHIDKFKRCAIAEFGDLKVIGEI